MSSSVTFSRPVAVVLGTVVLAGTGGGIAWAHASAASSSSVTVCTTRQNVVVSASKRGRCRPGTHPQVLSQGQGPQGVPGTPGTAGIFGTDTGKALEGKGAACTIGTVQLTAGSRAVGVPANGQLLPIASNEPLFSLIGTTYGGDGVTTFALPDLRAAAPDHMTYSICNQGIFPSAP